MTLRRQESRSRHRTGKTGGARRGRERLEAASKTVRGFGIHPEIPKSSRRHFPIAVPKNFTINSLAPAIDCSTRDLGGGTP